MTLEWATSSPPPEHNFESLPPIRSERPVWDMNHPEALSLGHNGGHHDNLVAAGRVDTGDTPEGVQ
jgi:cytochrome c oxidase subunit 1